MTFHTKLQQGLNYCVLGSINQMDILFDYSYCHEISDNIKYLISEKVVLQMVLIIILQVLEVIHIILYPLKKY